MGLRNVRLSIAPEKIVGSVVQQAFPGIRQIQANGPGADLNRCRCGPSGIAEQAIANEKYELLPPAADAHSESRGTHERAGNCGVTHDPLCYSRGAGAYVPHRYPSPAA